MSLFSRFPSYDYILENAGKAFRRFPFTLLSAVIGTVIAVILVEQEGTARHYVVEKLGIECGLGIALFTALAAYAEKHGLSRKTSLLVQAGGVLILVLHYFTLPDRYFEPYIHPIRIAVFALALHLLVAFVPYLGGKQAAAFWQYNKSLFLRILTSVLYSGILYAGLAIALAAVNVLFDLHIDEKRFFQLWIVMAGVFNTWIFLSGFPEGLDRLGEVEEYPRVLRILAQYILLPLVGLYLVILYAYELKIILTWNWPQGWVSHLVLWYSVVSILSILLLWPLREREGNLWIKTFSKWFFRLLVPLIVMLFLAIFERVGDYGMTVNRYLVIAMATGLSVIVLYFVLSREKDIRYIPIIVFIVALLSAWGPWSAFSVAQRSQQNRLESYLDKNELSFDQPADTTRAPLPFEDQQQMSSIVSYLAEWHGADAFSPWLSDSVLSSMDTSWTYQVREEISKKLGFEFVEYRPVGEKGERWFSLTALDSGAIPLGGYDYLAKVTIVDYGGHADSQKIGYRVAVGLDSCAMTIEQGAAIGFAYQAVTGPDLPVTLDLSGVARYAAEHSRPSLPRDSLSYDIEGGGFSARVLIEEMNGRVYSDSVDLNMVRAIVLFRNRE